MASYKIHNGARDVTTRATRASNATHRGLKQYIPIGQQRLLRGRPIVVTEEQLNEKLLELRGLEAAGLIYVTTLDERVVDLSTLTAAPSVIPPRPNFPLDSAANDKRGGNERMDMYNDPPPVSTFEMPVAPPQAAVADPVEVPPVLAPEIPPPPPETTLEQSLEDAFAEPELEAPMEMPSLDKPAAQPVKSKKGK